MMKISTLNMALWSMILMFSVSLASCDSDDEETPAPTPPAAVIIPDASLEAQIKLALGLGESDAVNAANILLLDTLDVDAGNDLPGGPLNSISDLTGLEAATNLRYLHFGATSVTDLTPIADLENITYLRMNNTAVSDLSPISGYTGLTYFNANTATSITDISPLAGNTGLKEAIFRDVPFGDAGMATIANFTSLYRLNMRSTGVTDISVLAELMAAGALQNSTPGAEAEGGASLDLRGLTIDCSVIEAYIDQITSLEGC